MPTDEAKKRAYERREEKRKEHSTKCKKYKDDLKESIGKRIARVGRRRVIAKNVFEFEILHRRGDWQPRDDAKPTTASPGTEAKIAVMRKRLERGQELFNSADEPFTVEELALRYLPAAEDTAARHVAVPSPSETVGLDDYPDVYRFAWIPRRKNSCPYG